MRQFIVLLSLLAAAALPANSQMIGTPAVVNLGINFPVYPQLQPVPGYPVYYAPQVDANYFFYDGMYWVYQNDNWYASSWFNGPWSLISPMAVPVYILRVPVRYYREPPVYFRGWRLDAAPRWDSHWGEAWERQRAGWNHWNSNTVPPPAPLPSYQQPYTGKKYPSYEQQRSISNQNYHYQPRDPAVQQHYQQYQGRPESAHPQQEPPQHAQQQYQQGPARPEQRSPGQVDKDVRPPSPGTAKAQGDDSPHDREQHRDGDNR
jgi:hypothetical protein